MSYPDKDEALELALAASLTSLTEALHALSVHRVPLEDLADLGQTLAALEEALLVLAIPRHAARGPGPVPPWPCA